MQKHFLDKDDTVGAIVITGSEKAFAAGADISEMSKKNMVDAIRFWCYAFGLTTKIPAPGRGRATHDVPTNMGAAFFSEHGFDPYMEDPTTLWILH